jgi:hypothetical protein
MFHACTLWFAVWTFSLSQMPFYFLWHGYCYSWRIPSWGSKRPMCASLKVSKLLSWSTQKICKCDLCPWRTLEANWSLVPKHHRSSDHHFLGSGSVLQTESWECHSSEVWAFWWPWGSRFAAGAWPRQSSNETARFQRHCGGCRGTGNSRLFQSSWPPALPLWWPKYIFRLSLRV